MSRSFDKNIKYGITSSVSLYNTLTTLRDAIDTEKMLAPSFMMVVTANGKYAYRRPDDGVYIVPIGCLKD